MLKSIFSDVALDHLALAPRTSKKQRRTRESLQCLGLEPFPSGADTPAPVDVDEADRLFLKGVFSGPSSYLVALVSKERLPHAARDKKFLVRSGHPPVQAGTARRHSISR